MGGPRRVHIHKRDALEALAALVPPRPARGLAMIDPSFEDKDEYQAVVRALGRAQAKWPQGIFLIWYPMLPAGRHQDLITGIQQSGIRNVIQTEWRERSPGSEPGLYGSGVILVNPPWQIENDIRSLCDWLVTQAPAGVAYRLDRLAEQ
jgi:23S rRNA (adenine2030-N6)-methyltransferase